MIMKKVKEELLSSVSTSRGMVRKGELIIPKGGYVAKDVYPKLTSFKYAITKSFLNYLKLDMDNFLENHLVFNNIIRDVFILNKKNSFIIPIKNKGWQKIKLSEKNKKEILEEAFNYIKGNI